MLILMGKRCKQLLNKMRKCMSSRETKQTITKKLDKVRKAM